MSFEESLVFNASPTLASLKVANLYSFKFKSMDECKATIQSFNRMMNDKGIYIELMKNVDDFYLIYVYRKSQLQRNLKEAEILAFLEDYGYSPENKLQDHIEKLKIRLFEEEDFPHEIGLFLGYPLRDVMTFIEKKGKHCLLCGDWKVYHDEEMAKCLFCKYRHCKDVYEKVYRAGRNFGDMLVCA